MTFMKTCYICGAKVENLYNNMCENCFKEQHPPIQKLKPLNIKFCNNCLKIHYANQLIPREEFEQKLPEIIKKNITIDKHYTLKNLKIKNFKIEGTKVSFDIEVNCDLRE